MLVSLPFFVAIGLYYLNEITISKFSARDWMVLIFNGILGYYFSSLLDFYGLAYITAGLERLILFVYPSFVAILSIIFLRRKVSQSTWAALLITYIGIALVVFMDVGAKSPDYWWGVFLIILCAFTYAVYLIVSEHYLLKITSIAYNSMIMTFACLGVIVHFIIEKQELSLLTNQPFEVYGLALLIGIGATVLPSYAIVEGVKRIGSGKSALYSSIGPVWTIILANLVLYEPISWVQILGTGLVMTGIFIKFNEKKTDLSYR